VALTYDNDRLSRTGIEQGDLPALAKDEFTATAHKINEKAREVGADDGYSVVW
jgi:hypothetical protein